MTPPPMMTTRARLGKDVATVAPGAGAGGTEMPRTGAVGPEAASPETAGTGALCIEPLLWLADDRSVSGRQEKVQMKSKRRPQRRRTPDQDVRPGRRHGNKGYGHFALVDSTLRLNPRSGGMGRELSMSSTRGTPSEHERDSADLARFGYRQELKRSLGLFSSFAVAFSYISPSTGIFTLFALGLSTIGGVFIWSWPIVALGQLCVALGFAELSSHSPVAGSVFQWTKYLAGKTYSWFAGWIYLFAGILTVTAVCVTLPLALIPAFNNMGWNLANSLHNQRIIAIVTLAEETKDPRREAPRAIIGSIVGAFIIGGIFLYAMLLAIPNLKDGIKNGFGPAAIIDANFGNAFSTVFLLVVAAAIFVCCLSIMTSTVRLCFGMSRDDRLPGSRWLAKVHPRLPTPIGSCLAIGAARVHPDAPVRGSRNHRDRCDRDDLPELLRRQHGAAAGAPARLAEDEGAVLAWAVRPAAEPARPRLGRRHADQLRLAAGGDESAPDRVARDAQLPLALAEREARALDGARRNPARRRDLLRARPAYEAGAPGGARGRAGGGARRDDADLVAEGEAS